MFVVFNTVLAGTPEPIEVKPEPRPEVDFVLLWADAKLMRAADGGGAVQVAALRKREPGNWLLARVLDRSDAGVVHVSLATHSNLAEHCVASRVTSAAVDLQVWVFEADMQPVVTKGYKVDETLTIRPGTPLVDGRPWMPALHLPLPPPEDLQKGVTYRPDARPPAAGAIAGWLAPETAVLLGETPAKLQAEPRGNGQILIQEYDAETKTAVLDNGCGRVEMVVETPPATDGFLTAASDWTRGGRPHFYVAANTPISWDDGTPAGKISRKRGWADPLVGAPTNTIDDPEAKKSLCWEEPVGLDIGATAVWMMCVPGESVVER